MTRGLAIALVTAASFALAVTAGSPVNPPQVVGITAVATLVAWPLAGMGLYAGTRWVGVDPAPLLAWVTGAGRVPKRAGLIPAVAVAGGFLTILLSIPVIMAFAPVFEGATPEEHPFEQLAGPDLLRANLLVVAEELVFRLGAFFPLVALFGVRDADRTGRVPWRVWAAILASGVLFGLAHAPDASLLSVDPTGYALFAVVQKGIVGGGVFGYVAWRWGLEASVLTHYAANMVAILLSMAAAGVAG